MSYSTLKRSKSGIWLAAVAGVFCLTSRAWSEEAALPQVRVNPVLEKPAVDTPAQTVRLRPQPVRDPKIEGAAVEQSPVVEDSVPMSAAEAVKPGDDEPQVLDQVLDTDEKLTKKPSASPQSQQATELSRLMGRELEIIRVLCQPTPDQFLRLQVACEKHVKQIARFQTSPTRLPTLIGIFVAVGTEVPKSRLRHRVQTESLSILGPECITRLKTEANLLKGTRKQAVIGNLVARLEVELGLSPEQRNLLVKSFGKCRSIENYSLRMFLTETSDDPDEQSFPAIPDSYVLPHLTETQKVIWRDLQKDGSLNDMEADPELEFQTFLTLATEIPNNVEVEGPLFEVMAEDPPDAQP
jgi:hypothetical protein